MSWEWIAGVKKGTIPQEGEKLAPFFVNEHLGIISLHDNLKKPLIYQSSNGGVSWVASELPYPDSLSEALNISTGYPQFFNENQGVLPVSIEDSSSDKVMTYIYDTEDGGNKWTSSIAIDSDREHFQLSYDFVSSNFGWLSPDGVSLYRRENHEWKKIFAVTTLDGFPLNNQKIRGFCYIRVRMGYYW